MQKSPEIDDVLLEDARAALRAIPDTSHLTRAQLLTATKHGDVLVDNLVTLLMAQIPQGANQDARGLIETALSAGVRACTATEEFRASLSFDLLVDLSHGLADVKQVTTDSHSLLLNMQFQLKELTKERANDYDTALANLRDIAAELKHPKPHRTAWGELCEYILNRVQEQVEIIARIEATGAGLNLGDLKAEIAELIAQRRYGEADARFDAILAAEDEAGELNRRLLRKLFAWEGKADTAILEDRVEDAFSLLERAANSSATLDSLEPTRCRLDYFERFLNHGLRHGGAGLVLGTQMLQTALAQLSRTSHPLLWAHAQNSLGNVMRSQSRCTAGREGVEMLATAVTAYTAALQVYTEGAYPLAWAKIQNNLGGAYQMQSSAMAGPDGARLLAGAVAKHTAALRVIAEDTYPLVWARTQNALGNAMRTQGSRTAGTEGAGLLVDSVTAHKAALRIYTEDAHPTDWAMTQSNLGNALAELGERTAGPEGTMLQAEAVTAYTSALQVYTEDAYPVFWARTLNNLGNVLRAQGNCTAGPEGAILLVDAVTAYKAALRIYTEDAHPLNWAGTQHNLGNALRHQGSRIAGPEGAGLLVDAVSACSDVRRVYTEETHPLFWAMAQESIALAELTMAQHDSCAAPRSHLRAALAAVDKALGVFDPVYTGHAYEKACELRDALRADLREDI